MEEAGHRDQGGRIDMYSGELLRLALEGHSAVVAPLSWKGVIVICASADRGSDFADPRRHHAAFGCAYGDELLAGVRR